MSNLKQKKRETQDDIIIMWNIFEIRVYIIVCIIQVSMQQKYKKTFEETENIEQKKCPEQSKIDITNDKIRVKHMLMLCS